MEKKLMRTPIRWFSAVVAAGGLAVACGGQAVQQNQTSSTTPITIGALGPVTNDVNHLGEWDYDGAKLAIDQANAKGGVAGRKIEVTRYDDQGGNPTVAAEKATQAVSDKVTAVFGPPQSTPALAVLPTLTSAQIPQFTSAQSGALLQKGSSYVFMTTATSPIFDKTLADYLVKKANATSIAMISNNDSYGVSEHDSFLGELTNLGVKPAIDKVVSQDPTQNFTSVLTEIRGANPKYLFVGTEEVEAGQIAKQGRSLGLTATYAMGAAGVTPTYLNTAGAAIAEGTIVSSPYLSNDVNAQTKAFAAAYQKAYGSTPELHGAKAYDGMNILIAAMKKTPNDLSGPKLIAAIRSITYQGLQGTMKYDDTGLAVKSTQIGTLKNGVIVAA